MSGGRDGFKKLAQPRTKVKTVRASRGIYFKPEKNICTYGTITADDPDSSLRKAHISDSATYDSKGRETNAIALLQGAKYLIAGVHSFGSSSEEFGPEILIYHRGKLWESSFEIPCTIEKNDLWLLDSAGKWVGTEPLFRGSKSSLRSGCFLSYDERKWSSPDMCAGEGQCRNAPIQVALMRGDSGIYPPWLNLNAQGAWWVVLEGVDTLMSRRTCEPWKRF